MKRSEALAIREKVVNGEMVVQAGGIRVERVQSDKLGFDWDNYYVNDICVKQVYIEQEIPFGTEANPIVWNPTMKLIQNAFYINDGVRKVWMGSSGAVASWDDEGWEIF